MGDVSNHSVGFIQARHVFRNDWDEWNEWDGMVKKGRSADYSADIETRVNFTTPEVRRIVYTKTELLWTVQCSSSFLLCNTESYFRTTS